MRRTPYDGRVRIFPHSGLRKRMRAAARGLLPDEVLVKLDAAIESAARAQRHKWQKPPPPAQGQTAG